MTKEKFDALVINRIGYCKSIFNKKGPDYTQFSNDRLKNFKDISKMLENFSPLVVWFIYLQKHMEAIKTYVLYQKVTSDPIEERITDAINYLLLGEALIKDLKEEQTHPE